LDTCCSNAHFSEFFNVGKARCSQIINSLEKKKLITIVLIRKGKSVVKRILKCTGNSLKRVPKITPKAPQNGVGKTVKTKPLKVVNILNKVVNKLNNPIKFIKQPYLINDQGSNTKTFNNTKESNTSNKHLSDSPAQPVVSVSVKAHPTPIEQPKKQNGLLDVFKQYPAHRRGGTNAYLRKLWKSEKLTEQDAQDCLTWLVQASERDPQWSTDGNGRYVLGITNFVRQRKWLAPLPDDTRVLPQFGEQAQGTVNNLQNWQPPVQG